MTCRGRIRRRRRPARSLAEQVADSSVAMLNCHTQTGAPPPGASIALLFELVKPLARDLVRKAKLVGERPLYLPRPQAKSRNVRAGLE